MMKRFQRPVVRGLAFTATLALSTATFGSTIPADYEQLEYIESTGSQWIDTQLSPTYDTKAELDLAYPNPETVGNNGVRMFGVAIDNYIRLQLFGNKGIGSFCTRLGSGGTTANTHYNGLNLSTIAGNITNNTHRSLLTLELNESSSKFTYLDKVTGTLSEKTGTFTKSGSDLSASMYLFTSRHAASNDTAPQFLSKMRFYAGKITQSGVVQREFVPVRRCSDNAVGLLDLVAYRQDSTTGFYANKGSGVFTAGAATGCIYVDGKTVYLPTTATWTNATGDGDPANPANWACTNFHGEAIASALPTNVTVVTIPNGCTNDFPASKPLAVKEVKLPATLGADNLDWSGITAPLSGTLDLQGKNLTLSRLTGDATITDSTAKKYELLSSITSTGTQWIDTQLAPTYDTKAELDLAYLDPENVDVNGKRMFGVSIDNHIRFMLFGNKGIGSFCTRLGSGGTTANTHYNGLNLATGTGNNTHRSLLTLELNDSSSKFTYLDTVTGTSQAKTGTFTKSGQDLSASMYLFTSRHKADATAPQYLSKMIFYAGKITQGGVVQRNLVPARRCSDKAVGLLDLANRGDNEFYANKATSGSDFTAGTVTNCAYEVNATNGTLHVNVAAGTTNANTTVALSGALKLVKEGAGAFVAAKTGQAYFGGTAVAAGLLSLPANATSATGCLGATSGTVRVDANATLELNGNVGFDAYPLVLAGGEVRNTSGESTYNKQTATLGRVTLEADSTVTPKVSISHTGLVDLNGHTLTVGLVSGQSYTLKGDANFTDGTVNITSGGFFRALENPRDMRTVNLYIGAGVSLDKDIQVNDLWLYRRDNSAGGSGSFRIYGTYMTKHTGGAYYNIFHRNCEMQNGSTLDLSTLTGAWSLEPWSTFSNCNKLMFAKNATVTVLLGNRKMKSEQIVSWLPENAPDATVAFVLEPDKSAGLVRKSDGLWLQTGFLIRIR